MSTPASKYYESHYSNKKKIYDGAREMAQQLQILTVLAEDHDLVLSTQMVVHIPL